MSTTNQ